MKDFHTCSKLHKLHEQQKYDLQLKLHKPRDKQKYNLQLKLHKPCDKQKYNLRLKLLYLMNHSNLIYS